MEHVRACLNGIEDRKSSFHRYGSPVRLMQSCLCVRKTLLTSEEML